MNFAYPLYTVIDCVTVTFNVLCAEKRDVHTFQYYCVQHGIKFVILHVFMFIHSLNMVAQSSFLFFAVSIGM